jgi:hypothetical protein
VYSRKRLRLRGFDYGSDGLYLVTVCTHGRRCLLGSVHGETMIVNTLGELVERQLIGARLASPSNSSLEVNVRSTALVPGRMYLSGSVATTITSSATTATSSGYGST